MSDSDIARRVLPGLTLKEVIQGGFAAVKSLAIMVRLQVFKNGWDTHR